ncbi:YrdB family protein [Modestobacter excelsi]|uniref:YrdB family protein n=1 Tax=Modestobacter excelsi TaxID=2213161 RepID=UPI00110CB9D4|nr:YrdB family protein [Modestobacter excelsi]
MGTALAWVNATVAFGLELAALAVLGWAGWQLGGPVAVRVVLAVALPVAAAVLWSSFAAPRAAHPSAAGRLAVQALVFGAAAVLLAWGASPRWGVLFAVVVVANLVAAAVLPSVGSPTA